MGRKLRSNFRPIPVLWLSFLKRFNVDYRFEIKDFYELTLDELYDVMWLRNEVFVVGQKITAEPEIDGLDRECAHAMLYLEDRLIGTARVFTKKPPISVGRVAIHGDYQRGGHGTVLMERLQQALLEGKEAMLHAQAHLEAWYSRLGWVPEGEIFIEAEIEHRTMRWNG